MNPKATPLKDYIAETMATLKESPESTEIVSGGQNRCVSQSAAITIPSSTDTTRDGFPRHG